MSTSWSRRLPPEVGVILVAAGRGRRLGGSVPKQYRPLGGIPMLLRALRPFVSHPAVDHVVVVLPPGDSSAPPAWLADLLGPRLSLVDGGAERSDSVAHGLAAVPGHCRIILVHDAARPFVERDTIDAVIAIARGGAGAVPATPVGDTLKEAGEDPPGHAPDPAVPPSHPVSRTIPRDRLWAAQTPQGFPRGVLEEAHARARQEGLRGTDDAMLVERLGVPVRLVAGSVRNFKVTSEADIEVAEALLQAGRTVPSIPTPNA